MKPILYNAAKSILTGIAASSYVICLSVAMLSVILYILGCKKAGKYASVSLVIYILIEAVKASL